VGEPKKRRRRSGNAGGWSQAEMRALETYRSIIEQDNVGPELRDILLPNRTKEEINAQLEKLRDTTGRAKRTKLLRLEKEEAKEFEKENERWKKELDKILGLGNVTQDEGPNDHAGIVQINKEGESVAVERHGASSARALDQALGLVKETEAEKRKRELDEALGLTWN
jgi:hypothetical protein